MLWCLYTPAALLAMLALLALFVDPPNPRRVRPGRLARGCVVLALLAAATALGAAAVLITSLAPAMSGG